MQIIRERAPKIKTVLLKKKSPSTKESPSTRIIHEGEKKVGLDLHAESDMQDYPTIRVWYKYYMFSSYNVPQ